MTCKEAERLVIPYIHHQLDDDTMSEFLEHIEVCPNCKEELEIYYTVEAGIRQLDKDTGHYNIKGDMEADLQASRQRLHGIHVLDVARYAGRYADRDQRGHDAGAAGADLVAMRDFLMDRFSGGNPPELPLRP